MSTGIGSASPSARSSDRIDEVVALLRPLFSGIEFDALDNAPVKFVVLLCAEESIQTHLRTLASIAKFSE